MQHHKNRSGQEARRRYLKAEFRTAVIAGKAPARSPRKCARGNPGNGRPRTSTGVVLSAVLLTVSVWQTEPLEAQLRAVTLPEALDLAISSHPNVIQAIGDRRVAQATRRQAVGNWLPSLSGSSAISQNSSSRFDPTTQRTVSGSATSLSAGISASVSIFDGLRRPAQSRVAGAELWSAEESLTFERFNVALQTKQAFFNALAADELVRVAQTRISRAEQQLKITRDKLAAGTAIRSDTLRSFVELGSAQLQLLNAQTQRATAEANLARLIGTDDPVRAVVPDSSAIPLIPLDTAALRAEAARRSPDIRQAQASADAARARVAVSRAQYLPSLTASYQNSLAGTSIGEMRNTWSARLSFNWQIFNGFSRELNMAQSTASRDAAEARLADARRINDARLTQQFANLSSALVRLQIATASREAALEDLRVQQERYNLGVSTIVELLNSQVGLDQAEVDIVQARLDYLLAKAEIETIVGREL